MFTQSVSLSGKTFPIESYQKNLGTEFTLANVFKFYNLIYFLWNSPKLNMPSLSLKSEGLKRAILVVQWEI